MRQVLGFKLGLLFFLAVTPFSAQEYTVVDVFTDVFNQWITIQNTKPRGTIDAHEEATWKAVRKAWKRLDATIKYE